MQVFLKIHGFNIILDIQASKITQAYTSLFIPPVTMTYF